ncbi:MAG: AsmA-like C-terminal domain-containing protein [Geminicoccaceae bacterium]
MAIRISRFLLRLLTLLLTIAAVAAGFLAWKLTTGPVSVAWLNPYVERQLSGDRVVVDLDDTQVRLGGDQLLELTAIGVRVRDPQGRLLSELPKVEIGLSTSALLREGAIAVRRIEAAAPSLLLTRREDGSIGFDDGSASVAATDFDIGLVLADFLMPADRAERWRHIEEIRIAGGELVLDDRKVGRTLHARDAELRIARLADRISAQLTFTITQASEPVAVNVLAIHQQGEDRIGVEVEFEDLLPAEFADFAPDLPLSGIRLPLSGKARGAVALDGEPSPTRFEITAQPGMIELPDLGLESLPVDALAVRGTLAADLGGLVIDRLSFSSNGAHLGGHGEVTWRNGQPTLQADLEAANVGVRDLERYWPPREGRQARKWVIENITAGVVPKVRASLRFGPGELGQKPLPEHTLDGEFVFEDLSVHYFGALPPLVGASGSATFTGQRMDFAVATGHVGDLILDQGSVVITGIGIAGRDTTRLEVGAQVRGPLEQALDLIDQPPLGFAGKVGIAPETAAGEIAADLHIAMPLHRDLEASEVQVAAQATITNGALAGAPLDVSAGELTLSVNNDGADLVGAAVVEEVPLRLDLRENFGDAAFKRRYRIEGAPDLAALRRLGLDLPIAAEGSLGLDATITEAPGGREVELALDLAPVAIDAPRIGWHKAAGEPATLDLSAVIPPEGPIRVPQFRLASRTLRAEGSLEAHLAPFQIERLRLDRVRLGDSDATVVLRRGSPTGYEIEVNAGTLDLTPLLDRASDGAGAAAPLRLGVRADRLVFDGKTLHEVDADLVRDPEGWRWAEATARLPAGGDARLSLVPEGDRRQLRLTSTDAGNLLRTLDQTSRVEGGELMLEATISQQRPSLVAEGRLEASDFRVLDAPILARLLTLASPTGISDLLGGEGLSMERIEAPFAVREGELQLESGRMYGSQLGLTFKGQVDLEAERLDLDGTVVPLYGINWTIGQIPLIGQFLRGEEGEGAFAATYTIRGPFDDLSVAVNPLAALAPGFLRELFTGLQEGTLEPPEMLPSYDDR